MTRWLWYFLFYSLFGFLLEVSFARVAGHPKRDRKCFLLLPLCPVYGLGALGVLALPDFLRASWPLLWLAGGGVCTGAEYLLGTFYETALGVRFWDYAGLWGNVKGRVCPLFTLVWGGVAVLGAYVLHPLAAPALDAIPPGWTLPAVALLTLDSFATLALLTATGDTASLRWYAWGRALRRVRSSGG